MSPEHPGSARHQVYVDLVAGLIDAREDPASARFDDELDRAVAAGTVTAETARRLRFWQRASVRAMADHVRSVIPTAIGALDASRREAHTVAQQMAETLGADPQQQPDGMEVGLDPADISTDTPSPASSPMAPGASTLGTRGNRLIVADLVTAVPDVSVEHR